MKGLMWIVIEKEGGGDGRMRGGRSGQLVCKGRRRIEI
jgi:hypothetical protein